MGNPQKPQSHRTQNPHVKSYTQPHGHVRYKYHPTSKLHNTSSFTIQNIQENKLCYRSSSFLELSLNGTLSLYLFVVLTPFELIQVSAEQCHHHRFNQHD